MLRSPPSELLTAEQSHAADRLAEAAGVPGIRLMERAGQAVTDAIRAHWFPCRALVVCGTGNNGGDGFVIARLLRAYGFPVTLAVIGHSEHIRGDAALAKAAWQDAGGEIAPFAAHMMDEIDLVVDALFGTGLNRPLEGEYAAAIRMINQAHADVVAVDIPSGVNADTGDTAGVAITADMTVTFFRATPGHYLLPGKQHCGRVEVRDIGIPEAVLETITPSCFLNHPENWRAALPRPAPETHKYRRGHSVIIGGAQDATGAARLAAEAALRAGSGLVTVACDAQSLPIYAAGLRAVMAKPLLEGGALEARLEDTRPQAWLAGPGAGVTAGTRQRVEGILKTRKPCVLDADALSVFAEDADTLSALLHSRCVLTPHQGEFRRVFGAMENASKPLRAGRIAQETGAVVVLKGNDTVIASPDGHTVIQTDAPPLLATAGSGDVLAGIIVGLLAQGMPPFPAACAAVWLHAFAARQCGVGLTADDLPGALPAALQRLYAA